MALLKLNVRPCNINIITAYTPTFNSTEEEIENFYNDLGRTLDETKNGEANIIFNLKVGKRICGRT